MTGNNRRPAMPNPTLPLSLIRLLLFLRASAARFIPGRRHKLRKDAQDFFFGTVGHVDPELLFRLDCCPLFLHDTNGKQYYRFAEMTIMSRPAARVS